MELTGNETWIAAGVGMIGMIVSFFFGKAGVFQKTVDFIFKSKETRAMKIEDEISARETRPDGANPFIVELAKEIRKSNTEFNKDGGI